MAEVRWVQGFFSARRSTFCITFRTNGSHFVYPMLPVASISAQQFTLCVYFPMSACDILLSAGESSLQDHRCRIVRWTAHAFDAMSDQRFTLSACICIMSTLLRVEVVRYFLDNVFGFRSVLDERSHFVLPMLFVAPVSTPRSTRCVYLPMNGCGVLLRVGVGNKRAVRRHPS